MAVGIVTRCPINMMSNVPINPTDPTANPKRKNMTAPRMVEIAVKKTGNVPKLALAEERVLLIKLYILGFSILRLIYFLKVTQSNELIYNNLF